MQELCSLTNFESDVGTVQRGNGRKEGESFDPLAVADVSNVGLWQARGTDVLACGFFSEFFASAVGSCKEDQSHAMVSVGCSEQVSCAVISAGT